MTASIRTTPSTEHETVLRNALETGKDPHNAVAAWLFHTTNPTPTMRIAAKRANFGYLYNPRWLGTVKWPGPPLRVPPVEATNWDNWKPCRDVH